MDALGYEDALFPALGLRKIHMLIVTFTEYVVYCRGSDRLD